jgi:hypothetical protein
MGLEFPIYEELIVWVIMGIISHFGVKSSKALLPSLFLFFFFFFFFVVVELFI